MLNTKLVSIGNGIYARTKMTKKEQAVRERNLRGYAILRGESVIEQYWAKQAACPHTARDPRGKCYACGKEAK